MIFSVRPYLISLLCLFGASAAYAADPGELGGFELGGTFKAAQQHARQQEWELEPLSENLPGQWAVKGAPLTLFVCNRVLSAISETLEGDLEAFAARVFAMQLALGEPEIKILHLGSGVGDVSTIDARFETIDGGAAVQLQSIGGKRTFVVNHWLNSECQ